MLPYWEHPVLSIGALQTVRGPTRRLCSLRAMRHAEWNGILEYIISSLCRILVLYILYYHIEYLYNTMYI